MRILTFNVDLKENELVDNIAKNLQSVVHIDIAEDLEEFEYLSLVRKYDLFILNLDNSNYKNYLNIFKVLNTQYSKHEDYRYKLFITYNEKNSNISYIQDSIKRIYKNLKPQYKNISFENKENIFKTIIANYFYETPSLIKSIDIKISQKIITIEFENDSIEVKVKSKKDLYVLLYFIRHYGEIVNVETILSGISKEPELSKGSPVEAAISSLRKAFKALKLKKDDPIVALKRIGYKFEI